MLNLFLITDRLRALGLGASQLAEACDVSREAASNWLTGESLPRPRKLRKIAEVLGVTPKELLVPVHPEPIVAYRTKRNAPASTEAMEMAADVARHLRELVPYIERDSLFTPGFLDVPSKYDDEFICEAARQTRVRAGLTSAEPITNAHLISMHRAFGSILVPVLWGEDRIGHENALSVYLPDSQSSWVIFNLNSRIDDFNYWMAHELAHCYTLNKLQGSQGEAFAERFAQALLFPEEAASKAFDDVLNSADPMARVAVHATAHDISIVTVVRQIDRIAMKRTGEPTGLETQGFWQNWNASRHQQATVAYALFGINGLTTRQYIEASERTFGTCIFRAIARRQSDQNGPSPSFISTALNIHLGDAADIAKALAVRSTAIAPSEPGR